MPKGLESCLEVFPDEDVLVSFQSILSDLLIRLKLLERSFCFLNKSVELSFHAWRRRSPEHGFEKLGQLLSVLFERRDDLLSVLVRHETFGQGRSLDSKESGFS